MAFSKQVPKAINSAGITTETISSCLACVCLTSDLADVHFSFPEENERRIPAHKMILALRSSVFRAMFYGSFPQEVGDIRIMDVEANIFQQMMRYLYTDNIHLDGETVVPLLYTAQKYQVTSLMSICAKYLKEMITVHNACTIFSHAKFFDLDSLRNHALTFIANNASDVFDNDDFLSLSCEHVSEVLRLDSLCLSEIKVFLSILRWAEQKLKSKSFPMEKKKRDILLQGGILYLIAIPLLSLDDYTKYVVPSGILTDEEQLHIFKAITMKQLLSTQNSLFRIRPRKGGLNVTISIDDIVSKIILQNSFCYGQINDEAETIYLKPSRAIRIVALNVNPKYQMNAYQHMPFDSNTSKIICTIKGKTVNGVLQPQSSLKLEVGIDVKPKEHLEVNVEIFRTQGMRHDPQYSIKMMPQHNYERQTENFMFQHKLDQSMIEFSFDGLYLVGSIEIMHL